MAGTPLAWCALYYVGTGPSCRHIVRCPSRYRSESGWQGRPGYLQEKILQFTFLVSLSTGHLWFLGCVYLPFRSGKQPGEKVKVFVSVYMSPCLKWWTCGLTTRKLHMWLVTLWHLSYSLLQEQELLAETEYIIIKHLVISANICSIKK